MIDRMDLVSIVILAVDYTGLGVDRPRILGGFGNEIAHLDLRLFSFGLSKFKAVCFPGEGCGCLFEEHWRGEYWNSLYLWLHMVLLRILRTATLVSLRFYCL